MKCMMLLLVTGCIALSVRADDMPKQFEFARYQPMMDRSPFAVATAQAAPAATPSIFKDLFVANAAKLEDEDVATLNSSADKNVHEYVSTKGPNAHGFLIANIDWSDKPGETKVNINKDGQFGTLTFNQALLTQPISSAPGQPQVQPPSPNGVPEPGVHPVPPNPIAGAQPGAPTAPGAIRPAPIPSLPTPPPHVRGVIPRTPASPPPSRRGGS